MFPFILGLGGFILFVSIELLYQLSEVIVSYKVPIWRLFELLYYNIPMFTVMGIPVGVLLAIFWILSQMGSNSELMALQVHGISFKKIVIPFLILGAFFQRLFLSAQRFRGPGFQSPRFRNVDPVRLQTAGEHDQSQSVPGRGR